MLQHVSVMSKKLSMVKCKLKKTLYNFKEKKQLEETKLRCVYKLDRWHIILLYSSY